MLVLAAVTLYGASTAGEKKIKKIDPEEQLRLDASELITKGGDETGYVAAIGKFALVEENNEKSSAY